MAMTTLASLSFIPLQVVLADEEIGGASDTRRVSSASDCSVEAEIQREVPEIKDDLAAAHKHCAEAWFKIRGNKYSFFRWNVSYSLYRVPSVVKSFSLQFILSPYTRPSERDQQFRDNNLRTDTPYGLSKLLARPSHPQLSPSLHVMEWLIVILFTPSPYMWKLLVLSFFECYAGVTCYTSAKHANGYRYRAVGHSMGHKQPLHGISRDHF
ncbi:hypothetical protein F3Y22_tig00110828pilonHSYRG00176 [Hibiscus syriacus]|uniref:Uncharacterized protein n=1 Tax=Hibiscus syriacus TaxID=106335 RepID=A0A6A2ZMU3_HIBSY|nr:hypothetical protein F3Y22_tig00110828pilonHSYRG00176 [Hibiscus syriacus]